MNVTLRNLDSTPPAISIASPEKRSQFVLGQSVLADYSCSDDESTVTRCEGRSRTLRSTPAPSALSLHCRLPERRRTSSKTHNYSVVWPTSEFASPVNGKDADGNSISNRMKAGGAVPVKFSLGGNRGLDIFADGYPQSGSVSCENAEVDDVEETLTTGNSGLRYDEASDQYSYVWKTDKAWAGSCRQLVLKLADGTYHRANFEFAK